MRRVTAHLELDVAAPARLAVQVAVACPDGVDEGEAGDDGRRESLEVTVGGAPVPARELATPHGGRLHVVDAGAGRLVLDYAADVPGRAPAPPVDTVDLLTYLRPSRYCESDRLAAVAAREFRGLTDPHDLLAGVSSWVGARLTYVPGSSGPTDGAVDTLLAGRGVCRDYAHLVVALLRARDVPARLAAVYAPGLAPMDFHAVAEAYVAGGWQVVDGTLLAPRSSLLRIATGRDAADTAFLSTYGGAVTLLQSTVTAVVDGDLPGDDPRELVVLG